MLRPLLLAIGGALLSACAALPPETSAVASPACTAGARRAPADPRIARAVDEARRQHQLFGGQTVERDGGMFRVGAHEAEWAVPPGESAAAWQRVAMFWTSLSDAEPVSLATSIGRVVRREASPETHEAGSEAARAQLATREALLRAAIVDTPWSAAFISHLMKTAGFSHGEFAFSDSHVDYVQAAFDASAAEAAGREATHAFRACDVATTRPRAGDLLCATRASTADTARFDALAAAMLARAPGQAFPMHCDLVVRSDEGGDARLDAIGGNVINSVTLSRMTLNARRVLSETYFTAADSEDPCSRTAQPCRGHLSRRPWVVVLQFRQ